jgi:peptidoglycan/LPS O-acetylase OafA/YrhL
LTRQSRQGQQSALSAGAAADAAVFDAASDGASRRHTALYRYMPALDGLRGIAILWVIALHLPGQMDPGANPIARRGTVGVELFFAISGFLVTRSLYQCVERAAGGRGMTLAVLRDFAARRVSRIWPPYFLALTAAFGGMMLDPTFRSHSEQIREVFWAYPAFLANYVIPTHEPSLALVVMWSLCFEEQFYVLLLLMYVVARKRLGWLIAGAALASISARLVAALFYPEVFTKYVMQMETHWRFDAIAWGCLAWVFQRSLAEFWERRRNTAVLQALLAIAVIAVSVPLPADARAQAFQYLIMAPVFAAMVSALAFVPAGGLTRALAWTPLALVGVISYEIYLTHVVVYRVLERAHPRPSILSYLLSIGLAIGVGWLFHRLFGKPTQRWVRDQLAGRAGKSDERIAAPVPAQS